MSKTIVIPFSNLNSNIKKETALRDYFIKRVLTEISYIQLNPAE